MKGLAIVLVGLLVAAAGCGSSVGGAETPASTGDQEVAQPFGGMTPGPCDAACRAMVEESRDQLASMDEDEVAEMCAVLDGCFFPEGIPEPPGLGGIGPERCTTNWEMGPAQNWAELYDWWTGVGGMAPAEAEALANGVIPRQWQDVWSVCHDTSS